MIAFLAAIVLATSPRIFLAVDHPFVPDRPGSIVRVELEGSHTIDVRLYELREPGKYLSTAGTAGFRPAAHGGNAATSQVGWRSQERARLTPLLTDAAMSALHLLAPGPLEGANADPPFLRGEKLLRRWTLPCGANQAHSYCDVDLGPIPAGVYLVEGISGGQSAYAVALSTRLALTSRRLLGQLALATADTETGEPRANVPIEVTGPGGAEQKGTTNAQGILVLKPSTRRITAVAHTGNDWAQLDVDYFSRRGHGPRIWLTTDRGETRPGESVRFVGIERPAPAAPREVPVSLEDGRGTTVATVLAHEDERGLFTGFVDTPVGIALGIGHLVADCGGRVGTGEIDLRDPASPELALDVDFDGVSRARVHVHSGKGPVASEGEWHLLRTPLGSALVLAPVDEPPPTEIVAAGDFTTGEDGTTEITLPVTAQGDARLRIEVATADAWGRRATGSAERTRLDGPWHLDLEADRRIYLPAETARVAMTATDATGQPATGSVSLRVSVSRIGPSGEPTSTALPTQTVALTGLGKGELMLPNLEPGYYEIEGRAGAVPLAEVVLFVTAHGGDIPYTPDALTVVTDRPRYGVGDTARVLVLAPFESATALFTAESTELVREDALIIHGSSALAQVKVPVASGMTFTASAIFAGQAYLGSATVAVGPANPPLQLDGSLSRGAASGLANLVVHARDAAGKPLSGVEVVATWRDAAAERSLGPPATRFLDPPATREGQTDVSLDFHRAGYSHGSAADRLEHLRTDLSPLEGFTPQKGQPTTPPRALHSTTGGLERLPPTDRSGSSQLTIPLHDAHGLRVEVVAVGNAEASKAQPVAEVSLRYDSAGPYATPTLPTLLRSADEATVLLDVHGASAPLFVNGVSVADGGSRREVHLTARNNSVAAAAPEPFLRAHVPIGTEHDWRPLSLVQVDSRHPIRTPAAGSTGDTKLRLATGASGLLDLLEPTTPPLPEGDFERHGQPAARPDSALGALALALARSADLEILGPRAACVVASLLPDGSLPESPIAAGDPNRTALALILLDAARARGAGVPSDWTDRVRDRVEAAAGQPGPAQALSIYALGGDLPVAALSALVESDVGDTLSPTESAALALALDARHLSDAAGVAVRLEHRGATAGGRSCWESGGCDPADPPSSDSISSTALAAMALAVLRPHSPRLSEALRYLAEARRSAVSRQGTAAAFLPLAIAQLGALMPEGTARVTTGSAGASITPVSPGAIVELSLGPMPAGLRESGVPVWVEVDHRESPLDEPAGTLQVERRWWAVDPGDLPADRAPLEDSISRGDEVWVEISVHGAAVGEAVHIEDPYPGGLAVSEQPETHGPLASLKEMGGHIGFSNDRVVIDARATAEPLVVGYLARAIVAGHFHAPPAEATAGNAHGRSSAADLEIEGDP